MTVIERSLLEGSADEGLQRMIVWGGALIISLPFLVASYRKLDAPGMMPSELAEKALPSPRLVRSAIRFVTRQIPIWSIIGILVLIAALSARILPPTALLIARNGCRADGAAVDPLLKTQMPAGAGIR